MQKEKSSGCLVCRGLLSDSGVEIFDTRFGIKGLYNVRRCSTCGLEQIFPVPSKNVSRDLYEKYYNFGGEKGTIYTFLRARFLSSILYRFWLYVDSDISFHSKKGTGQLLDIGCNEGRGLKIYKQNGFEVEGLELNEFATIEARKSGFRVYTDPIEEFQPDDVYDIIVLSNVLEHSLQPDEMLAHIARILKPGGQIWISCPNVDSWQREFFGKYWINWHVPFHIVHFSQRTLKFMLQHSGFEIQELSYESPALWLAHSIIVRLFAQLGLPTKQLRNPFWVAMLLILIRTLFFPILWLGNRLERGDCLVVVASKVLK